jgi:hypothetical protein
VERTQRLVFLVLLIGWTLFRLVRYLRIANSKRAGPGAAPAAGALAQRPAAAPGASGTAQSPIEPEGRAGGGRGWLAATAILVAGNVLIWAILFAVPAFDNVPAIWRLTAGVLANLFLIRAASAVARAGNPARPRGSRDHRNPIR